MAVDKPDKGAAALTLEDGASRVRVEPLDLSSRSFVDVGPLSEVVSDGQVQQDERRDGEADDEQRRDEHETWLVNRCEEVGQLAIHGFHVRGEAIHDSALPHATRRRQLSKGSKGLDKRDARRA